VDAEAWEREGTSKKNHPKRTTPWHRFLKWKKRKRSYETTDNPRKKKNVDLPLEPSSQDKKSGAGETEALQ